MMLLSLFPLAVLIAAIFGGIYALLEVIHSEDFDDRE